jgi:hypothetical protein
VHAHADFRTHAAQLTGTSSHAAGTTHAALAHQEDFMMRSLAPLYLLLSLAACGGDLEPLVAQLEPAAMAEPPRCTMIDRASPGRCDVVAVLARGACLGGCPVYQVVVFAGGEVEYRGMQNVAVAGERHFQLSREAMDELHAAFEQAEFFGLEDLYRSSNLGAPRVVTGYEDGQLAKLVVHDHGDPGAPERLFVLEDAIDSIVGTAALIDPPAAPRVVDSATARLR